MKYVPSLLAVFAVFGLIGGALGQDKGVNVKLEKLQSRTPADWKPEKSAFPSRLHQFRLPRAEGDKEDAEVTISHFGPGEGGGVAENLKRWKDQFVPPSGKTTEDVAKVDKIKIADMEATVLDISGTYKSRNPPFAPNAKEELKPDWRLTAIYVPCKEGPYFLRLIGPAKTVEKHKKGFDEWVKAFK